MEELGLLSERKKELGGRPGRDLHV